MNDKKHLIEDVCRKVKGTTAEVASLFCEVVAFESEKKYDFLNGLSDVEAAELANAVADRLNERNDVGAETLKMQARFHAAYAQELENVESVHKLKQSALDELRQEIIRMKPTSETDFETISLLHRRVFSFLMLAYDEKLSAVEREVAAAMESVFPRAGLKSFVSLSASDKSNQLMELFNIVLGIRLFNKEVGKGGVAIENVPQNLLRDCASLSARLEEETRVTLTQLTQATDVAFYFQHIVNENGDEEAHVLLGRAKNELIHRHQYHSLLHSLHEEVTATIGSAEEMHERYSHQMKDLTTLVGGRSSVPKDQVYPKFDVLAATWLRLDALLSTVVAFERIFKNLLSYREPFDSILDGSLVDIEAATGASETQFSVAEKEDDKDVCGASIIHQKDGDEDLHPALNGFCPVTLVDQRGLLQTGNRQIGLVLVEQTLYVCATEDAQARMIRNPSKYTVGVHSIVRDLPQLVHLLRLDQAFPALSVQRAILHEPSKGYLQKPKLVDVDTQTPTHFVEKNIDHFYDWNEWNLRRRALQLADLRTKATTSAQSTKSHFRRDNVTQHYEPRTQETQTMKDAATSIPKNSKNLIGGRGDPDSRVKIVNLQLDL